jgi:hypothetical protein
MNKKKHLKEDTSFTLSKGSSPYKIYRAPDPVMNADDKLKQNWIIRRQMEQEANIQKQQTVAEIEKLEQPLCNLFRDITNIRNHIEDCKSWPMVTQENIRIMKEMQDIFDGMNKDIIMKIIPLLDQLGLKPNMNKGDE